MITFPYWAYSKCFHYYLFNEKKNIHCMPVYKPIVYRKCYFYGIYLGNYLAQLPILLLYECLQNQPLK